MTLEKLKAKIFPCPNKRMAGAELRRLLREARLSEMFVATKLGSYRMQVRRWEDSEWFELEPPEMQRLLHIIGASSI